MTISRAISQLTWMIRATSYAGFVPPGLATGHRTHLIKLLHDTIRGLDADSARQPIRTTWELWNHPHRAAALRIALHTIRSIPPTHAGEVLPRTLHGCFLLAPRREV